MIIKELEVGSSVILELEIDETTYSLPTKVVKLYEQGIIIEPVQLKGIYMDLTSPKFRRVIFTLYGYDVKTSRRYAWRGISLEKFEENQKDYYYVYTNTFKSYGQVSERRSDKRLRLGLKGVLTIGFDSNKKVVVVNDISVRGVSFISKECLDTDGNMITLVFQDTIRDGFYQIDLGCECVRKQDYGGNYLYGCRFLKINRQALNYICLKKAEQEAKAAALQAELEDKIARQTE